MDVQGEPREACRRGHPLDVYGRPRADRPGQWSCGECKRIWNRRRYPSKGPLFLDETTVWRVVNGERPEHVNRREMLAAVTILTDRGLSTRVTAMRCGITQRTVSRMRLKIKKGIPYGVNASREEHEPPGGGVRAADHG